MLYYLILIVILINAILAACMCNKYLSFKKSKELYKANVAYKICCVSGVVATSLLFVLACCF